mmetsp:Transcript_1060/g.3365  ORF Transcript_1060/g.3365 Transcript_1060/m.3365 type:complete len:227 (-) Transcript_1060:919-1599(-)
MITLGPLLLLLLQPCPEIPRAIPLGGERGRRAIEHLSGALCHVGQSLPAVLPQPTDQLAQLARVCPGLRDGYFGGGQFGRFGGGGALDLGLEMLGLLAVGREGAVELGSLAGEGRELAGHLVPLLLDALPHGGLRRELDQLDLLGPPPPHRVISLRHTRTLRLVQCLRALLGLVHLLRHDVKVRLDIGFAACCAEGGGGGEGGGGRGEGSRGGGQGGRGGGACLAQ